MPATAGAKTELHEAPGSLASMARAPAASAEASPEAAMMKHVPDWQQRREQQCMPRALSVSQANVEDLVRRGVQRSLAELAVTFLQVGIVYHRDKEAAPWARLDLNHMLPGAMEFIARCADAKPKCWENDLTHRLVSTITPGPSGLPDPGYRMSPNTPVVGRLLRAMLAAEPCLDSTHTTPLHDAHLVSSNAAAQSPGVQDAMRKGQSSPAMADKSAGAGSSTAAEAQTLSQQSADRAADAPAAKRWLIKDVQEAARPQGGLSEAEKAEKRKVKKARQRAARAQAAAQTGEAEGTSSKATTLLEGTGSASKQKPSADAQAADQHSEAAHLISDSIFAAPRRLSAHSTPAPSSEEAASSNSSLLSPQPSLRVCDGLPHGQAEGNLPRSSALAAQAPAPAAQEEGLWQEARTSRRKAASQQAASKAGARKAPSQGRAAPDQRSPAPSPVRSRDLQTAAQRFGRVLPRSGKVAVLPHAEIVPEAAEHLPSWLPGPADCKPQQSSQHEGPDSVLRPRPQGFPSGIQHEASQPASADTNPKDMLHRNSCSGTFLNEQTAEASFLKEGHPEDDEALCIVCWEKLREVIFCHCMHMITCQGCAKDIMAAGALCPMCRASIQSTITAKF